MPYRYKITIAYDGAAYAGWQIQPGMVTIQEALERAIQELSRETSKVHGSGRTDQGVHARAQVAHFDLTVRRAPAILKKGLNALLPRDIRILDAEDAPDTFHARRSASGKEYRYFIWNGEVLPPFYRLYKAHVRAPLDVRAMNKAAGLLIGRHDFAAFTANPNRIVESTVRDLTKLKVMKRGSEITIVAVSDGFLYKMVRSLCGFLIRAGEGAVPPEEAGRILHSRLRTARVPTAPPQGLFLWRVMY